MNICRDCETEVEREIKSKPTIYGGKEEKVYWYCPKCKKYLSSLAIILQN